MCAICANFFWTKIKFMGSSNNNHQKIGKLNKITIKIGKLRENRKNKDEKEKNITKIG